MPKDDMLLSLPLVFMRNEIPYPLTTLEMQGGNLIPGSENPRAQF
jgi:hypothetical protein